MFLITGGFSESTRNLAVENIRRQSKTEKEEFPLFKERIITKHKTRLGFGTKRASTF